MGQKDPCSLPFIRRAAIILGFRDMASESERGIKRKEKIMKGRLGTQKHEKGKC